MKRAALWLLGGLLLTAPAHAQSGQAGAGQVQAIRPSGAENLSRYLSRLASNPHDIDALIGAGEAAADMDDMRAAAGFFARADAAQPNNARVKAGLGRVMLKTQNPAEALRLFDQATRLGFGEATLLADRGLARDMTGDQAGAQRDYQAALRRAPDDAELIYRYAASLGISGQGEAAEKLLQPLLYKGDRAAWRYRVFILAMNNRQADARKIASQTMPGQLAAAITPYLQKMPNLTAAQKAAAVHFGHFPANVGTVLAAATPTPPAARPVAPAPSPSLPARPSSGATTLAQAERPASVRQPDVARAVPPQPQPQPQQAPAPAAPPSSNVQGPPAPGFDSVPNQRPASPAASSTPTSQLNAISLAQASAPAPQSQVAPAQPAAAPPPANPPARQQPNPEATRTLADIIRAIDVPDSERQSQVAAVDLTEIEAIQNNRRAERQAAADKAKKAAATKAKAEADAKAKKLAEEKARLAANPSRNWVQVGTGASRSALEFTLKGLRRKYDAIAPQDGWLASWGRTNRLLIGPFASFTRARTVESKLKAAGADVFAWKSGAGELVERLGDK